MGGGGRGGERKDAPLASLSSLFASLFALFTLETPDTQVTRFYFFSSRYLPFRKSSYRHAISSRSRASNTESDLQGERKQEIKRSL